MRDLDSGWLLRHIHANGASFLFIMIYLHMFRTLYHGSPSKSTVWIIGIIMYILLCAISFTGYSLVYGQMSLWAIVVICSLVTAIPYIGNDILINLLINILYELVMIAILVIIRHSESQHY